MNMNEKKIEQAVDLLLESSQSLHEQELRDFFCIVHYEGTYREIRRTFSVQAGNLKEAIWCAYTIYNTDSRALSWDKLKPVLDRFVKREGIADSVDEFMSAWDHDFAEIEPNGMYFGDDPLYISAPTRKDLEEIYRSLE